MIASDLIKTYLARMFYQSEAGLAPINELEPGRLYEVLKALHDHGPNSEKVSKSNPTRKRLN
jgi:hypothetical protein